MLQYSAVNTACALVSSAGHSGDNVFKIQFYLFRSFSPFYLDKAVIFFVFFFLWQVVVSCVTVAESVRLPFPLNMLPGKLLPGQQQGMNMRSFNYVLEKN